MHIGGTYTSGIRKLTVIAGEKSKSHLRSVRMTGEAPGTVPSLRRRVLIGSWLPPASGLPPLRMEGPYRRPLSGEIPCASVPGVGADMFMPHFLGARGSKAARGSEARGKGSHSSCCLSPWAMA